MYPLKDNYNLFKCRVCQSKDFLMNIFVNESQKIVEKLCFCASIQISENDALPQHICTKCFADLQISYRFRKQCEEMDAKLRRSLKVPVKVEVESIILEGIANVELLEVLDYSSDFESCKPIEIGAVTEITEADQAEVFSRDPESDNDKDNKQTGNVNTTTKVVKNKIKAYTCDTCQEKFIRSQDYYQHIKTHGKKRFKCRTCSKWFSRRTEWRTHESKHAGTLERVPCSKCPKDFCSRTTLLRHISEIHDQNRKFVCNICGHRFAQKTHLQAHHSVHSGEHYTCKHCGAAFKSYMFYMRHEQNHLPPEERDPKLCNLKVYRSKTVKTYVCAYCGKVFNNYTSHVMHERAHTGVKPYSCQICGKAFMCTRLLRRHERIHTGVRPHKCDTCGKCFVEKQHLITHTLTHTQIKRFVCQICSKGFTLKCTLKSHMKCHAVCEKNE
ncbi:zinc finger protein 883-like [Armigeres subalbatus]|uniref:zinc finger protein 883-like n=1 Tax=Armigeres subalbatus TaxID=124917 RepID=UPI002ED2272A